MTRDRSDDPDPTELEPEDPGDDPTEALQLAQKRIDMAASKGVIHTNAAARRKSRLTRRVTAAQKS